MQKTNPRDYSPPTITVLGDLATITRGGTGGIDGVTGGNMILS